MGALRIVSRSGEPFQNRKEAGELLAVELSALKGKSRAVLGIPRGGVVVAREVSRALDAALDIVLTRKLPAPHNPELAIGAVSEDGRAVLEKPIVAHLEIDEDYIEEEKERQLNEIRRRASAYRNVLPKLDLTDRIVIVTDDGVATGATMQASLLAARREKPEKLVAALPVGAADTLERLSAYCDELVALRVPPFFGAVGQFYTDFEQTSDEEVLEILMEAGKERSSVT
jgi:predicted phosphoribosyltransferase